MDRKTVTILLVGVLIAIVGYFVLTLPDRRTGGEKFGDAVESLSEGVEKAGRELQDRTPAQKLDDAIDDAKKDMKE